MKKIVAILLVLTLAISMISVVSASGKKFPDLSDTHWAAEHIYALVDKGIIDGNGDGTFKPNKEIAVDEFIKLAVTALGHFPDKSNTGYWADPYINKAKELKLISQVEFTNYRRAIKREEMASVIVKAYSKNNTLSQGNLKTIVKSKLSDYSLINDNYKDVVLTAYQEGLITGKGDGSFDPRGYATRAEASTVIMRLLDESLRKPFNYGDLPYTMVTVNEFTPENGWTQVEQKYYAPINDKGNPVEEVLTLHDEIKKIEKQDDGYFLIGYNPIGQKIEMEFYPSVEISDLPVFERIPHLDMGLNIKDLYFKEGYYPYNLIISRNSEHYEDMSTYYSYLDGKYGDFLKVYANTLFEDNADTFLERFKKNVNNTKSGIVQRDEFVLNDRKVYISTNNGINLYISDQISE